MSALPMETICCSPPESVPETCADLSFKRGKSPYTSSSRDSIFHGPFPVMKVRAQGQIIRDAETGKQLPALGNHGYPFFDNGGGGKPFNGLSLKSDIPFGRRHNPRHRLEQGGFPGAVGTDDGYDTALPHMKRHALQGANRPVKDLDFSASRTGLFIAQIRLDYAGVRPNGRRWTLGNFGPVIQDQDFIGNGHDHFHVMLHQDHGNAPFYPGP